MFTKRPAAGAAPGVRHSEAPRGAALPEILRHPEAPRGAALWKFCGSRTFTKKIFRILHFLREKKNFPLYLRGFPQGKYRRTYGYIGLLVNLSVGGVVKTLKKCKTSVKQVKNRRLNGKSVKKSPIPPLEIPLENVIPAIRENSAAP